MEVSMEVSIKDFVTNPYKFLSARDFTLTKYGKPFLNINITKPKEKKENFKNFKDSKNSKDTGTSCLNIGTNCLHKNCQREGTYFKGYCMEHWREALG